MQFNPTNYPIVTPAENDTLLLRQTSTGRIRSVRVSAVANAASPLQVLSSIADLREVDTDDLADGSLLALTGYYEEGDGGGGDFYYDASSVVSQNGGTVISPDSGDGRFVRIFDGDVNLLWFGAKGDGSNDDTDALQDAGDYSASVGRFLYAPSGTYKITAPIVFDAALKLRGDGDGTLFDFSSIATVGGSLFTIQGEATSTDTTLSGAAALEDDTIDVNDSSGFSTGDFIKLTSTQAYSPTDSDFKKGELAYVAGVAAGELTLVTGLKDSYSVGGPNVVTVTKLTPLIDVAVIGVKIIGGGTANQQHAIDCFYAIRPFFSRVTIDDCEDTGISCAYCDYAVIENCAAYNMPGTANGVGYAFALDLLTQNSAVRNCTTLNVSCGFSTGGLLPVWDSVCEGNRFVNGTSLRALIQTHANGTNIVFANNVLRNGYIGVGLSGPGATVIGNIISGMSYAGISAGEDAGVRLRVVANKCECFRGIIIGEVAPTGEKASVIIADNDVRGQPTLAVAAGITSGATASILNNRVRNHSPGILVTDAPYSRVAENEVVDTRNDADAYGIYLSSTTSSEGYVCERNRVRSDIATETAYAIVVDGTVGALLQDNILDDVVTDYIGDSGTRTVIRANKFGGDLQRYIVDTSANVTNGTTAGRARTNASINYLINGRYFTKASTDDLWDLSGITTGPAEFKKVALCLDASGVASIVQGVVAASQTLARVPDYTSPKVCVIAVIEIPNSYSGGSVSGFVVHNSIGAFQ